MVMGHSPHQWQWATLPSRILQTTVEPFGILSKEILQAPVEPFTVFYDCFRLLWQWATLPSRILQSPVEPFRILEDPLESFTLL